MDSELISKFDTLKKSYNKVDIYHDILIKSIKTNEEKLESNSYRANLYQKASEVVKSWLEQLLDKNVNSMADLVTSGLNHIIQDQELDFYIKQEPKYNKIAMRFVIAQDGHEGDPTSSYGGGAVHIISLILRLAIMSRLNMANLLILDESLNALARKYVPDCGEFIRQLAEETNVNILMVTHNEEFLNSAHTSYEATSVKIYYDEHNKSKLKLTPYSTS